MVRLRLDSVVTVKEREEDRAAQGLARAEAAVQAAQDKVNAAHQRAMADFRVRHDVAQWEVHELATARAVVEHRKAQQELQAARSSADKARGAYTVARQKAEVVRRVADARRSEILMERERAESKALDEAAALGFIRRTGS